MGGGKHFLRGLSAEMFISGKQSPEAPCNGPKISAPLLSADPKLAVGIYDCMGFFSRDRRNMAPKQVSPAPRR